MSIFTSVLSLIGCKTEEEKYLKEHNVIFYQTEEFKLFEENSKIKLKDAFELQTKFANSNKTKPEVCLYFILDDNYVFSSFTNLKTPVASTRGIWVNSKTGEANKMLEWWEERYKHLKLYSLYSWKGEQCTTAVKTAIQQAFPLKNFGPSLNYIWDDTQKPSGLLTELNKFISSSKQHFKQSSVDEIIKKEAINYPKKTK